MISSYVYIWFAVFGDQGTDFHYYFEPSIELFFFLAMVVKFFTDFIPDGETEAEKSLDIISSRYLKGMFIWDLIPLVPLTLIFRNFQRIRKLTFMIKCIRIVNGINLFNVNNIMAKQRIRQKNN